MASLDDYNWQESRSRRGPRRRFYGFWAQAAASLALLLAVAGLIGSDSTAGNAARYVVGNGLQAESSWFSFGRAEAALPAQAGLPATTPASTGETAPKFLAPASGVVIKGMTLDEAGLTSSQGIIIQGVAGQSVKAAAMGEVQYMGESESGFIIEIEHANGFSSVYQGLSGLDLSAGQQVAAGEIIGATATGEVLFALFLHGEEIDPILYLFQQQV